MNRALPLAIIVSSVACAIWPLAAAADDHSVGRAVYRMHCASCHGEDGQGTHDKYNEPLAGDLSITELATVIDQTMPEGEPELCSAEESAAVAAYIHQAFYSEVARERMRPARIELARLTVPQFRNAVTDLFVPRDRPSDPGKQPGLHGDYYDGRRFQKRVFERVDRTIDFDFAAGRPDDENFLESNFGMRWRGSILAPETGQYEFCIETENAARLWINDDRTPLIDAWVRSGDDRFFRGSIFLLGGRPYQLRLEFLKSGELTGSIRLKWKPPRDIERVVPAQNLRPGGSHQLIVAPTKFPPDDSSAGYARGSAINKEWDQATTDAALAVADQVVARLNELAGTKADQPERTDKIKEFCYRLVEKAWCRTLSDSEREQAVDRFFQNADTPESAVKRVCLVALKSPSFLFRELGQAGDPQMAIATRLSFGMWDSLPDDFLLRAARKHELSDEGLITAQAQRMLADPRTKAKLREFLFHWLKLDSDLELAKDPNALPQFTTQTASDLRTSVDLFLDEVVWSERSDFRQLLQADYLFLNRSLAEIYAPEFAAAQGDRLGDDFVKVPCGADRCGVLTHPYLMATFSYTNTTSPIHRGVFLARSVLGRAIKAPPEAVTPIAPDLHASLTTRERVLLQTSPASCQTCHGMINPLGFGLENFDVIGRFRSEEKGKPINATGNYRDRQGKLTAYNGSRELANFLVDSPEVQSAFVQQLFYHLVKQPPAAFGPDTVAGLRERFVKNEFSIQKLIVDIMRVSSQRGVALHSEG